MSKRKLKICLNTNPNPILTNVAFSSNRSEIYVQTESQVVLPGSTNSWDVKSTWKQNKNFSLNLNLNPNLTNFLLSSSEL